MFIRSERLFLRPGWPEDRDELLTRIADEAVVRNLSSVPWPYSAHDAATFLDLPHDRLLPRFVITLPGAGGARIIGGAGLHAAGDTVELGYWIARDAWGCGYASEAARAVVSLAQALRHPRLVASHYCDNPASGRVLQKAGFRPTGRLTERFSKARGVAVPAREYELAFDAPGEFGGDHDDCPAMNQRRAA